MKHCYYILNWSQEKQMFVPIYSACRPVSLPKKKKGQIYATTHYSLDKRITEKADEEIIE